MYVKLSLSPLYTTFDAVELIKSLPFSRDVSELSSDTVDPLQRCSVKIGTAMSCFSGDISFDGFLILVS